MMFYKKQSIIQFCIGLVSGIIGAAAAIVVYLIIFV